MKNNIINIAKKLLTDESNALIALKNNIDDNFIKAIDIIKNIKGRVIVTGIGKSGHIGKKIAATLASTGTPAQFIHAVEASHGDLGMISNNDCVIAISNSGMSSELYDVCHYCNRFSISLIGITANNSSPLAQSCDITLLLPKVKESGTLGLAPTTSTTMSLALGDAIAITLLEIKGFDENDFHNFHPGGKLGKQLLKAADIMHINDEIPLINKNADIKQAILTMSSKRFGAIAVVNKKDKLKGIITDGDLRRHMNDNILANKITNIMTKNPVTITINHMAGDILALMEKKKISVIFVTDNNKKIVGVIHIHDLLKEKIA